MTRLITPIAAAALSIALLAAHSAAQAPGTPPPAPPTTANDHQKALTQQAHDYLVGTWRTEGNLFVAGTASHYILTLTYRADGGCAGSYQQQMSGYGGMQPPATVVPLQGTWIVGAVDEQIFNLVIYMPGQAPSSANLKIVDRNTMENTADTTRSYRL